MQEYIDLLRDLMACRSVSKDIPAVNCAENLMQAFLEKHGISCTTEEIDGRKVVYATTGTGKISDVLLNAHLDVVPPITPDDHILKIDGNILRGRGTDDCLGSAIGIAKILIDLQGKADVSAFFTADEEIGGQTTKGMADRGYSARKIAIVIDSSPFAVNIAQKGILTLKLTAIGSGGHSSTPWAKDNPIDKLIDAYTRFRAAWPTSPTAEDQWHDSMTPCIISGGFASNQIPDVAEMVVNIRFIKEGDENAILELARKTTGLQVECQGCCQPLYSDPNSPAIQKLFNAIQKAFPNQPVSYKRMNGATDARHLGNLGIPVAVIGFQGDGAHSANEWLNLDNARQYIDLLKEYIVTL